MKLGRTIGLGLAVLVAAGIAGGCLHNTTVPDDAICVVRGDAIPKSDGIRSFDTYVQNTLKAYEAQGQEPPESGTQERETLESGAINVLIRQQLFEQEADELGIEVTDEEVDERVEALKESFFQGDEKQYKEELEKQGLTEKTLRENVRQQVLREKIFEEVTKDVSVSDKDVKDYFEQNKQQYVTPASREVAHILVEEKGKADQIYNQVRGGNEKTFADLAKKESKDPSSAENGGELTIRRGDTVEEFDKTAFKLKTGEVSRPVKTQFGWHVITARSDVTPESDAKFEDVEEQIRAQLSQQEKSQLMTDWERDLIEDAKDDVICSEEYSWTETVTDTAAADPSDNVAPEAGDPEAGDPEAGNGEGGDAEAGDAEGGDADGGDEAADEPAEGGDGGDGGE